MAKKRKRILLVSPMPPAIGGISVSTSRLRDRLAEDGYEVDTYNLQIKFLPFGHALWQLFNVLWLPFYILGKKKYDIIHLHVSGYWRRVYVRLVRPLFKRARVVVTIHGDVANFIRMPLCENVLGAADRIICVRPGNRELLPQKLRTRTAEIPAFIMPPAHRIAGEVLPSDVRNFVDLVVADRFPLIVFNGSIVLSGRFYDLYGFTEMVAVIKRLRATGRKFAALMVVNDMHLDSAQKAFLSNIMEGLEDCPDLMLSVSRPFSLLPVLGCGRVLYVRPTKTDGDSLSVREALALGAHVVASDAAPRPDGAVCYDGSGGEDALYHAVSQTMDRITQECADKKNVFNDYYDEIIEVYDSLF